jgi:hypothetical protein
MAPDFLNAPISSGGELKYPYTVHEKYNVFKR